MTKAIVGIVLAVLIGAACRWFEVPVPAPNRLLGALLVVAITAGYLATDRILDSKKEAGAAEKSIETGR